MVLLRTSEITVKCPSTGWESTSIVVTRSVGAAAQLGMQLSMSEVPEPMALVAVQEDQVMPVTMFPASALKSISFGLLPW